MKSFAGIVLLSVSCFLSAGCNNSAGTAGNKEAEAERKAAEDAARAQRYEDLLGSGKKALEAKRFEEAVKDFREAIGLKDDPQARELLKQAQKAEAEARKAAYDQAMVRGGQARKEQNYPAAVTAFHDALMQIPNDKEAANALKEAEYRDFLEKGQIALKNEQFAAAVMALGEAAKRHAEDAECQGLLKQARTQRRLQVMAQGKAALTAQQYQQAVQCFLEAKNLLPDTEVTELLAESSFQAKLQLSRRRIETKEFAVAIPDLEEILRLKPDHAEARNLLAKAKEEKKRQDKADYDRAMAAGNTAMQLKDYSAAIKAFSEALAKQPQDGTASSKLTDAKNAKSKKESFDRHMSLGKTHLSTKNYRMAEVEFQLALIDMPTDFEAQRLVQQARQGKR